MPEQPDESRGEAGGDGDALVVCGASPDGAGVTVLRRRPEGELEVGRLQNLEPGRPLAGEVLRLAQRAEGSAVFDVEVLFDGRAKEARRPTSAGPPQVSSHAYRRRWDAIFGEAPPSDVN